MPNKRPPAWFNISQKETHVKKELTRLKFWLETFQERDDTSSCIHMNTEIKINIFHQNKFVFND